MIIVSICWMMKLGLLCSIVILMLLLVSSVWVVLCMVGVVSGESIR